MGRTGLGVEAADGDLLGGLAALEDRLVSSLADGRRRLSSEMALVETVAGTGRVSDEVRLASAGVVELLVELSSRGS